MSETKTRGLTPAEIAYYASRLGPVGDFRTVRFLANGQALEIETGKLSRKGRALVMQPRYCNISEADAREIACLTGTRAVFDN